MKNHELIKILQQLPQDMEVGYFYDHKNILIFEGAKIQSIGVHGEICSEQCFSNVKENTKEIVLK